MDMTKPYAFILMAVQDIDTELMVMRERLRRLEGTINGNEVVVRKLRKAINDQLLADEEKT